MRSTRSPRETALVCLMSLCAAISPLVAQDHGPGMAHGHMAFTGGRPGSAADSARAAAVVSALRTAIQPYRTLDLAERAGFRARRDPDMVKQGKLLHVGRQARKLGATTSFDPAVPQALLYRRSPDGGLTLAGAMFVAPADATPDDLDAMIPLSVAHWHQHLNVCVSGRHGALTRIPRATTAESCEAAGGRFRTQSRYMVHVMIDGGNDLAAAFPQGREQMEGMPMMEGER